MSTSCMKRLLGVMGNPLAELLSSDPQALVTNRRCLARFKRFTLCEIEAISNQIETKRKEEIKESSGRNKKGGLPIRSSMITDGVEAEREIAIDEAKKSF